MKSIAKRALALAVMVLTTAAGAGGWEAKAPADERTAARIVGGFSSQQRALYHQGLAHIAHVHQRPGQFTIRAVIQDERAREAQRARLRPVPPATSASPASPTPSSGIPWPGLLIIAVIVGAVIFFRKGATARWSVSPDFDARALAPIEANGITRQSGELFYWSGPGNWEEFQMERSYTGGYSGASFRIARGISIHSGGSRGRSKNVPVAVTEQGTVTLSNRRVIFIGQTMSRELAVGAWEHAAIYRDAIHFDLKNARPIQITSSDPLMPRVFERIVNGKIDAPATSLPRPLAASPIATAPAAVPLPSPTPTIMTFDSSHIVLRAQQGVMKPDRHELLVTLNMEKWNALSIDARRAALNGARKTFAEQTCTDTADVAYVLFLDDKGVLVGEASPTSCDLL